MSACSCLNTTNVPCIHTNIYDTTDKDDQPAVDYAMGQASCSMTVQESLITLASATISFGFAEASHPCSPGGEEA